MVGDAGNDRLQGDDGNDYLTGSDGNDLIYGDQSATLGTGNDYLRGDAGMDTLHGGAGTDTIIGGIDVDTLYGEAGKDYFTFILNYSTAAATDVIMDFSQGKFHQINVSAIDTNTVLAGDQVFDFLSVNGTAFTGGGIAELRWFTSGTDTFVEADIGDGGTAEVYVRLVGSYSLLAADFIL